MIDEMTCLSDTVPINKHAAHWVFIFITFHDLKHKQGSTISMVLMIKSILQTKICIFCIDFAICKHVFMNYNGLGVALQQYNF